MGPIENPIRLRIRLVRKMMKRFVQYKDPQWFSLRAVLNQCYEELPAKERAR